MKVAIIGAGGHGKVVADVVLVCGSHDVLGFLDDAPTLLGRTILGRPVLGPIHRWQALGVEALIPAIGDNRSRCSVFRCVAEAGAVIAHAVHPRAIVAGSATIGAGTVVMAGAIVNAEADVAEDVIINTGAIVEHDCGIGAHVHVAPAACLAGGVMVGEGSFVGMGARVLPGVRIGAWCIIGAGAVVTRDLPDRAKVAGVPARRLP